MPAIKKEMVGVLHLLKTLNSLVTPYDFTYLPSNSTQNTKNLNNYQKPEMTIKKKLSLYNSTEERGEGNPTSFPPDNDASSATQAGHQLPVQEYQQLATMYHCSWLSPLPNPLCQSSHNSDKRATTDSATLACNASQS